MYKKKITEEEFLEMLINKELEIAEAPIRYKDIKAMPKEEQREFEFFTRYTFKTKEQYEEWEKFFYDHVYDWLPKSVSKGRIKNEFGWINLNWGLKQDYNE